MLRIAVTFCIAAAFLSGVADAATVLITGSDRGLGLEFAKQYAARGDEVIATCRHPTTATELQTLAAQNKKVAIEKLDVGDDRDIETIAVKYKGTPIDLLINNAGVLGRVKDQTLGSFNRQGFKSVMDINVYGALALSEALRDNVIASRQKKIVALTSGLGSVTIARQLSHVPYYYSMSKAALNIGMALLSKDLSSAGVVVAIVSPGIVATDMSATFKAEYHAQLPLISTNESVSKMIATIDDLDQAHANQGIVSYDGSIDPW